MKAILLAEAKKWLEENCENQYTRMAVFGIMQSMPTVDYQETPNEPLTLEQLREMDGQPVYCGDRKEWGIIHIDTDGPWANIPFFRGVYCDLDVKHNGLTLYAYPPAHIDRDCGKDANVPTNADCIRAMSDEELAKAMDMLCPPVTNCIDGEECVKCWTDWLRQPAEGGVSMDYKKLSVAIKLCGSTPKVDQCPQCPYWASGDMNNCIPRVTADAATAITNLLIENQALRNAANGLKDRAEKAEAELKRYVSGPSY